MSKHHVRPVNRRTARRLLRGAPVAVPDALAGLLAAAAAPPRDGERDGEGAAVAAFADAARRATTPVPLPMIKTRLVKRPTVKVAAAAAALFAVGGVAAVAATTGHLTGPTSVVPAASSAASRPGAAGPSSSNHAATVRRTASPTDHAATPSPSLVGLCHAFTAGAGSEHGKALANPAFTALITAAGGTTKVSAYCTVLLDQQTSAHAGSAKQTGQGKPTDTTHPNSHSTSTSKP